MDNLFAIFDFGKDRLKSKMLNTRSCFFEYERNTIAINEHKTDLLEKYYGSVDNRHAKLLKLIQESVTIPDLSIYQMIFLQEFVSHIFWRLPENDKLYEEEYKNNPLFQDTFKIVDEKNKKEIHNEYTEKFIASDAGIRALRPMASNISHLSSIESIQKGSWQISYNSIGLNICSDNPIIFKGTTAKNIFEDDFIFPITKHHLLIRTFKQISSIQLPPAFGLFVQLLIFKQGKIYSCSADRKTLEILHDTAGKFTIEQLKEAVFNYFE